MIGAWLLPSVRLGTECVNIQHGQVEFNDGRIGPLQMNLDLMQNGYHANNINSRTGTGITTLSTLHTAVEAWSL